MSTLHDAIWTGSIDRGLPAVAAKSVDEINRLPYLLRFLKINEDDDTALERIQDRAVLYPTSENVQVITGYLAPHVCRKRNRVQDGTKPSLQEEASSADAMEVDRVGEGEDEKVDDLEGYVVNVWNDLHQLVELAGSTSEEIALSVPHSTFAQPVSSSLVGGGNDLAVALVSLMYHCDISHRALAAALCRANFSQSPDLVFFLGANCPSAVATLVAGCMDIMEECGRHPDPPTSVLACCRDCLRRLASLSVRQRKTVLRRLRERRLSPDLQLQLLLDCNDNLLLANFIRAQWAKVTEPRRITTLQSLADNKSAVSGREGVILEAYSLVLLSADFGSIELSTWVGRLQETFVGISQKQQQEKGLFDHFTIATVATILNQTKQCSPELIHALEQCARKNAVAAKLLTAMDKSDFQTLITVVQEKVGCYVHPSYLENLSEGRCAYQPLHGHMEKDRLHDLSADLDIMRSIKLGRVSKEQFKWIGSRFRSLYENKAEKEQNLSDPNLLQLVLRVAHLTAEGNLSRSNLPLLSQLDLQESRDIRRLVFDIVNQSPPEPAVAQYLVKLLYCLEFMKLNPTSPFRIDPYSLPLKELYQMSFSQLKGGPEPLLEEILQHIQQFEPDICSRARAWRMTAFSKHILENSDFTNKDKLLSTLRESIHQPDTDPDGVKAERLFLRATRGMHDVDLLTTTTRAIVSKANGPPVYMTASNLFRDPLLPLQCPFQAWRRSGIRRLLLYILTQLLAINASIVRVETDELTAHQMIAARDALVIRGLVSVMSKMDRKPVYPCAMAIAVVRTLVARRRGIVAVLLKQGLEERCTNWLVKYIPECIEDGPELVSAMSDPQHSLTAVERLTMANGILQIAVAHGRNTNQSVSMVYSALANLLANFFVIVGPVGVPVSALMSDDQDADATQKSREAMFRMLSSLARVRSSRHEIRGDCGVALQKLVTLCKSDTSNRQKALIKDIVDAAVKAANSIGISLQV